MSRAYKLRDNEMRRPPGGKSGVHQRRCDVEETEPPRDPGSNPPRIPPSYDYEYDEAHDLPVGPQREAPASRVDPPQGVQLHEGGDYGYDEAHDFSVGRSIKT